VRARRLTDLDAGFTVGELAQGDIAGLLAEALADALDQRRVRGPGEDARLTHVGGGRGVCGCRLPAADVCVLGAPKGHPLW
jgi:hypothetical protein